MEQQDVEEILGNLLENAAKFAAGTVSLTLAQAAREGEAGHRSWLSIVVEDDGTGLDEDQIGEAMKRGSRLDESKPGTGLGLSIVSEIVKEYQGDFAIDRGRMGGVRATLVLPEVGRTQA